MDFQTSTSYTRLSSELEACQIVQIAEMCLYILQKLLSSDLLCRFPDEKTDLKWTKKRPNINLTKIRLSGKKLSNKKKESEK